MEVQQEDKSLYSTIIKERCSHNDLETNDVRLTLCPHNAVVVVHLKEILHLKLDVTDPYIAKFPK